MEDELIKKANEEIAQRSESATENFRTGNQSRSIEENATSDEKIKRLEDANRKTEELLNRQEEILARQLRGGNSNAGSGVREKTQAELDQELADSIIKGFR